MKLNERGAALVEASIASTLLLILIAGILDYGTLFASDIDVSSAARSGARAGAASTVTGAVDDYSVVHGVLQLPGKKRANVSKIIVYKADSANAGPPSECLSGTSSASAHCNVYTQSEFSMDQATLVSSNAAQGWPATQRVPGTDFLGVYVEATRQPFFKIIWSPSNYSESMALRIPPPPPPTTSGNGWQAGPQGTMPYFTNDEFLCWPGRGCFNDTSGGLSGGSGSGGSG